jgi:hypothetical protein
MNNDQIAKIIIIFIVIIIAFATSGMTYALWREDFNVLTDTYTEEGEVDWEFWHPNWYITPGFPEDPLFIHGDFGIDPGWTKDVGSNWAEFFDTDDDGDFDTMHLVFENVYPYYNDHFAFALHCNGEIPIRVWRVQFTDLEGNIIPFILPDGTELEAMYSIQDELAYLDISGPDRIPDEKPDIFIWWGDNFGTLLYYCDSADFSFHLTILQPCPQNTHIEFLIKITAVQSDIYIPGPIDEY